MRPSQLFLIVFLMIFSLTQIGCASFNKRLKGWLGGSSPEATKQASNMTKFSESEDVSPRVKRQYKRTTKESLSDESALEAKAGSLWVMEGQGAYLFSQNVVRLVGDPLAVQLEGDPRDQLQSKAGIIKKLLGKIEERQAARLRGPSSTGGKDKDKAKDEGADKDSKTADASSKEKSGAPKSGDNTPYDLAIKSVPTRIIERTLEGNYRVKGSQPFMIGSREYKVIVTGIVRSEDFNDEGISATKLLEPKFDIVSARRKEEM